MELSSITVWEISAAILTSFGGGALIVGLLFKWLGDITAKRILQREQGEILSKLEELRQELGLLKSNYEKNTDWLIKFYSMFYRHYQYARRAARADVIQHPDKEDENTKAAYLERVDDLAQEWNESQALARILLPKKMLVQHESVISQFNAFKNAVKAFNSGKPETRKPVTDAFDELHKLKEEFEQQVRSYLRSEELAK